MDNRALKFLPIESGEKRIELSIAGEEAIIRLSSWVDGLGWCGEKTLPVNSAMLDDLHRVIAAARSRMKNAESDGDSQPSRVLDFPLVAAR